MKTPFFEKVVASLVLVSFLVSAPLYAGAGNTPNTADRGANGELSNSPLIPLPNPPSKGGVNIFSSLREGRGVGGEAKKDHDLRDRFAGNKLDRLRSSVKGKDRYTLLIRSNDGIQNTENAFHSQDKRIRIKRTGNTTYLVKLPAGTPSFPQERSKLDNGIIPAQLGAYEVVQPEAFEALGTGTGYLSGESTDKLWGMNQTGVPAFAEELSQKPKTKVWVLDTGIDATHSDLANNTDPILSYDFINNQSGSTDDNGHGTEVAGVLGAQVNGSGIFGSDPSADLISLKVLDQNGIGTTYDILEAIAYAKDNRIPVLNISFGAPADPTTDPASNPVCQAITDAKNQGTVTVVSAGNANQDAANTIPAACPDAVTVGATNWDNTKASFSNYGNTVDVYAPGTDIYTTTRNTATQNNAYTTQNGTSFSAPLVAGLVAKELAYDPSIAYDRLLENIRNNYRLQTNATIGNTANTSTNTSTTTTNGTTNSGTTSSGTTASGTLQAPAIDYSTYHYYSGTFVQSGTTYGNSLYPDSLGFQNLNLPGVQVYTYDEYMNLLKTQQGTFKALSVPTNGLVAEYLLNGNANDTSGNWYNGTASNVSWVAGNLWNQAQTASFNGTNSYINMNTGPSFTNEITASVFMNVSQLPWAAPNDAYYFLWQDAPAWNRQWQLLVLNNGSIQIYVFTSNSAFSLYYSDSWLISTNKNYHVSFTRDGNWVIKLFIDGVEKHLNIYSTSPGNINSSTTALRIWNRDYPSQAWYFNWKLSNAKVYNRALSSSEIQALYNEWIVSNNTQTTTPYSPTNQVLSNPLAQYDFRDTSSQMCISNTKQQSNNQTITKKEDNNKWDPVTLSKGEFAYDNTFMSIPGKKLPYEFKLSYKNQLYYNGPAGINWDHNYNQYLTGETNGSVLYYNGRLGVFRFTGSGGSFDYNPGLKARLTQSGTAYVIDYDSWDTYTFAPITVDSSGSTANKLSRIEDANGNNLNFAYSGGLLSTVTDTLGRNIVYSYYDHNRLKDVTDFNGHKVTMNYFTGSTASGSLYDLQSATIDNGTGSVKTIGFEYTVWGDDTANHNITRLIDAKGQTYVTNAYDSWDRVSSQVYGSGTITYAYTLSGSSITKNTVTDKLGNKTEYVYDNNGNQTQVKYFNPAQTSSVVYSYEYDSNGYMTKETKPRGNGFTYTYDSNGNLTEKRMKADITAANSSNDLVTSYTYNSRGQVLTQTNPNGVTVTNTYDSAGNILTKTTSGIASYSGSTLSSVSTYSYLSGGFLDTITDPEGNVTKFQYSSGQVSKIIRGTGSQTSTGSFSYDSYGNPTAQTDGEGYTKTAQYNAFNLLSTGTTSEGIVTAYEYDANNNKTKEIRYLSWGTTATSQFSYDLLDRLTQTLTDTASGKTLLTTLKYDENGNVTEKKVGSGALVKYTYNEFGKVSSERIIMNPSDSSQDIVTGYAYDSNGNLVAKTDPRGNTTTYAYDLYDRIDKETNPKGTYTSLAYDKDGSVNTKSVYSSGNTILSKSAYLYDGLGNMTKSTDYLDPVNSTGAVETRVMYDRNQRKTATISPHPSLLPGGEGAITRNYYDSLGRLSSTVDALGNTVSYVYDKRDLLISKLVSPHPDPLPGGEGVIQTLSAYDHDGRLVSETDNLSQVKSLVYDNLWGIIRSTDEAGHHMDYERNYLGKTTKETKYLSGGTAVVTQYAYDERGNLVSVKDPKNNETVYAYDGINRNTSVTYADSKVLSYVYDKNSNVASQTDPNGSVVTNSYDTTNLLASRSIQTGTGVLGITGETYAYDSLGRPTSATDSNGTALGWSYDPLGRLSTEAETLSGQSASTVSYEYDANGNRTSIASGTGYLANYAYDTLNRLTTVSYNSGSIASYAYTGILNTGISYGNGVNTVQTFDGLLRLSSLRTEWSNPGQNILAPLSYSYDSVGNITSDGQKSYAYDTIDRLLSATSLSGVTVPNGSEVFGYDLAGNRSSSAFSGIVQSYSGNVLNQYLSVTSSGSATGSTSYSYDNNGNVTNNGTFTFAYDYKNRLVKVKKASDNSTVAEYTYDVLGRRIQKTTPTTKTNFVYAGENAIQETKVNLANSGVLKTSRVYENDTDNMLAYETDDTTLADSNNEEYVFCASKVAPSSADFTKYGWTAIVSRCNDLQNAYTATARKMFFVQKDHLWSVIALTDNSGSVVQEYAYDTYGSSYVLSGSGYVALKDFAGNLHGNDRFFTGREYDGESGLYYYRARYYDANIGRFISRDPIWQVDNLNLYVYVQNNPLRFTDPMGLGSKPAIKGSVIWGFFKELIGFDTAYAPSEENVGNPVVKEDYGKYGDGVILGAGFFWPGSKVRVGEKWAQEIAEQVTKKYWNLKCTECAKELGKALSNAGVGFEKIVIEWNKKYWIYSEAFKKNISTNWYHEAIKVGDTVFDNVHKTGLKYEEWLDDFWVGLPWWPILK